MDQMPDPRTSLKVWFRVEMRRQRRRRGKMSQADLARETHFTHQNIGHYETGRNEPTEAIAVALDRVFETGDLFYLIWWFGAHEIDLDWWQRFSEFERLAAIIKIYQGMLVPGLLQTEAYMRAVLTADLTPEIDGIVRIRRERQKLISRSEPPEVQVLIDELALLRPFGGSGVMAEQMDHLVRLSELPRVIVQVIPIRLSDHAGVSGTFQVLTLPTATIAYVETQNGGRVATVDAEVVEHGLRWDRIRSRALPVDESRELLKKTMEMNS